jgi:hypothetical protein
MALTHALMGRTLESGRFTRHDALLEVTALGEIQTAARIAA